MKWEFGKWTGESQKWWQYLVNTGMTKRPIATLPNLTQMSAVVVFSSISNLNSHFNFKTERTGINAAVTVLFLGFKKFWEKSWIDPCFFFFKEIESESVVFYHGYSRLRVLGSHSLKTKILLIRTWWLRISVPTSVKGGIAVIKFLSPDALGSKKLCLCW